MLIGFAERDITPIGDKIMPGDFWPIEATEEPHGRLLVTAAAFTSGDESVILVSMDILSSLCEYADKLRERISEATGVPFSNILVAAIHTHTGPLIEYDVWTTPASPETAARTADLTVEAAIAAWEARAEAKLGVGKTKEIRYSFNRDFYMTDGRVIMNPGINHRHEIVRHAGGVDHSVDVMRVDDMDGNIKCFIVNYANHPDCYYIPSKKAYSADFPGYMRRALKAHYGEDVKVLFFNGTAGNINCIDFVDETSNSYYCEEVESAPQVIGEALAEDIIALNPKIKTDETDADIKVIDRKHNTPRRFKTQEHIEWAKKVIANPNAKFDDRTYAEEYLSDAEVGLSKEIPIEVHTIKLGPWAITGLPGEIYTEIGIKIKAASPFEHTLVFELANGTHGYIAPAYMVDSGVYESRLSQKNSCTDRTTADMLVKKALEHLNEIAGK